MNRIKTVNEFFKVLSEGNVVALFDANDDCIAYYKLIDNNLSFSGFPDRDYMLSAAVSMDFDKGVYVKYVKPEWYDNIPKEGRLCWVWDNDSIFEKYPVIILNYYTDKIYKFETADGGFQNAKLMTSDEIKRYYA
jgi:hypothetical protein